MSSSEDSSSSCDTASAYYKEMIEHRSSSFHYLNNNNMATSGGGGGGGSRPSSMGQQKQSLTSFGSTRPDDAEHVFTAVNVPPSVSVSERGARQAQQQVMAQQMRRNRQYFDSQQQAAASQGILPLFENQGIRPLPVSEHHAGLLFDDLFPSSVGQGSALGIIPRSAQQGSAADHRSLDYQLQHPLGGPHVLPYLVEASPYPPPHPLDYYHNEPPWDLGELWAIESTSAPYGGPLLQHRTSLPHESMVYGQRSLQGPSQGSAAQQIAQNAFDANRRSARLRHDTAQARGWIPSSQLTYDPSGAAGPLAAPPRQLTMRGPVPTGPISTRRQTEAAEEQEDEEPAPRKRSKTNHSPMAGENRLKIIFTSLGSPGEAPQHFGTKSFIIPDGLSGSHQVYHQRWKFDIQHRKIEETICVSWSITNLTSSTTCLRTETPREARVRETSGHTICNQLLRQALKARAAELELQLPTMIDNPQKLGHTQNLIKALRPKSCILGLLFFGLLHDSVQQRMRDLLGQPPALPAPITVSTSSSSRTTGVEEPASAQSRETSPVQQEESSPESASSPSASEDVGEEYK